MTDVVDFVWVFADQVRAALMGFNLWLVVLVSAVIGLFPGNPVLRALIATALSLAINTLWPLIYGLWPVPPDLLAMETHIRMFAAFIIALATLWLVQKIKAVFILKPIKTRKE